MPERVSILETGAVGDDTTDDTLAIQKAYNRAKDLFQHHREVEVFWPGGGHDYAIRNGHLSKWPEVAIKVPRGVKTVMGRGGWPYASHRGVSAKYIGDPGGTMFLVEGDDNYYDTPFEHCRFGMNWLADVGVRFEGTSGKENADTWSGFDDCKFGRTRGYGLGALVYDLAPTNLDLRRVRFDECGPYAVHLPAGSTAVSMGAIQIDNGTGGVIPGGSKGIVHLVELKSTHSPNLLVLRDSRWEINAPMDLGLVVFTPHPDATVGRFRQSIEFDTIWAQGGGAKVAGPSWLHVETSASGVDVSGMVRANWTNCYGQVRTLVSGFIPTGDRNFDDEGRGWLAPQLTTLGAGSINHLVGDGY